MKKDDLLKKIIISFGIFLMLLQFLSYLVNYLGIKNYNYLLWGIIHTRDPVNNWTPTLGLLIYSIATLLIALLISIKKIRSSIIIFLKDAIERIKIKRKIWFFAVISLSFIPLSFIFKFSNNTVNSRDHWGIIIVQKALEDPSRLFYMSAPISTYLLFIFHQLTSYLFSWDAIKSTEIFFLLNAPLYIFILLLLADSLVKSRLQKVMLFLLLISTGFMQFLFGWYDATTFGFVWMLLFLYLSYLYIKGRTKFIYPVLAFWLSFWTNASVFWFIPGLLFLYFFNINISKLSAGNFLRGIFSKKFLKFLVLLLIPTILLFLFIEFNLQKIHNVHIYQIEKVKAGSLLGGGDGTIFLLLFKTTTIWQSFTMFSFGHLIDFLNFNVLLAPFGLILLISLMLIYRKQINFKNPFLYFMFILLAFHLLFMATFNTDEVEVAAWDVYAPVHILTLITSSFILLNYTKKGLWEEIAIITLIISLSLTIPWILSNSHFIYLIAVK